MPLDLSIFQEAVKAIEQGKSDTFTSLSGSSGALLFSMLKAPCLLLCSSDTKARELYSDTVFWSRLLGVQVPIIIQPEGEPERLRNLVQLYSLERVKVIASVDALPSPLWKREEFQLISILKGSNVERDHMVKKLYDQGYFSVPIVSGPGEMCIRGGILDIFSPDKEDPVRIEFFGDEIESLRFFDVDTQLSVTEIEEIKMSCCRSRRGGNPL